MSILRCTSRASFVLLPALSLGLAACTGDDRPPVPAPRPALVAVVSAGEDSSAGFAGVVRAKERAVLSATVAGRVTRVAVDIGERVRRGQPLLVLDPVPLEAGVRSAEAALAQAEAADREAAARLARASAAATSGAASPSEFGELKASAQNAAAQVRAARAALAEATWRREEARLRAPIDGVVAARHVEPGQAIGEGLPAIEIDGGGRELVVDLPQSVDFAVGDRVVLMGPGGRGEGTITRLNTRVDAAGIRRAVVDAPAQARVGEVWSVRSRTGNAGVRVPLRAVQRDTAGATPFVLRIRDAAGRVAKVPVRLGAPSGDSIAVIEGLAVGDRVVIAGARAIAEGDRVVPVATLR